MVNESVVARAASPLRYDDQIEMPLGVAEPVPVQHLRDRRQRHALVEPALTTPTARTWAGCGDVPSAASPCDHTTAVTATQLREVVTRLMHAGQ